MKAENRKNGLQRLKMNNLDTSSSKYKTSTSSSTSPNKIENDLEKSNTKLTTNNVQINSEPEEVVTNKIKNEKDETLREQNLLDLERKVQYLHIGNNDNNIKAEPKDQDDIDKITNNIENISLKEDIKKEDTTKEEGDDEEEEDGDLIQRGPQRGPHRNLVQTAPYVQHPSSRLLLHQSGGQVLETSCTSYGGGAPIIYNPNIPTQHYSQQQQQQACSGTILSQTTNGCLATACETLGYEANITFEPTDLLTSSQFGSPGEFLTSTADYDTEYNNTLVDQGICVDAILSNPDLNFEQFFAELENWAEKSVQNEECEQVNDFQNQQSPNGVNIPPSYNNVLSPRESLSSGYVSSPSTPSNSPGPNNSNSPPNAYNLPSYYETNPQIPQTVDEISTLSPCSSSTSQHYQHQPSIQRNRGCVKILPKPDPKYATQEKMHKYLKSLCINKNESIFKRLEYFVKQIPTSKFTQPDQDGDTGLMKLIANPDALEFLRQNACYQYWIQLTKNPQALRLIFLYEIIAQLDEQKPRKPSPFTHKNHQRESTLHLACTQYKVAREHPILAAYIAETMVRAGCSLDERCEVERCAKGGFLLHCVARLGDEYAKVLAELLNIPENPFRNQINAMNYPDRLTPLQVAIRSHIEDPTGDLKVHRTVEVLIKHGASITVKDPSHQERTPLHMALFADGEQDLDLLRVLLKADKSSSVMTKEISQYLDKRQNEEVTRLFHDHSGKRIPPPPLHQQTLYNY